MSISNISQVAQPFDDYAGEIFMAFVSACSLPESETKMAVLQALVTVVNLVCHPPMMFTPDKETRQ